MPPSGIVAWLRMPQRGSWIGSPMRHSRSIASASLARSDVRFSMHHASARFWRAYDALAVEIRTLVEYDALIG